MYYIPYRKRRKKQVLTDEQREQIYKQVEEVKKRVVADSTKIKDKLTEEERILELEERGYKHREIGSILDLSPSKVYSILKRHNKIKSKKKN